jgi:membrane associated rhomboid family serine protease
MTVGILALLAGIWVFTQAAGLDVEVLAETICNYGLVPGELTRRAPLGTAVPIAPGLACVVDAEPINWLTPITAMFLHGSWGHLLGNALFLWVFGNNVEDSMGRIGFAVFYLLCGLGAAGLQIFVQPASPVPMVGASGAIAGVLGAYLILYPTVRVHVFVPLPFLFWIFRVPAYLMLLWWIGIQVLSGLPQLTTVDDKVSSGVAFFAHIGGFFAGIVLVKLFAKKTQVARRNAIRHSMHPEHA